jgi:hypothetical protein
MPYVFQSYPWTMTFNLIIGRLIYAALFAHLAYKVHVSLNAFY